jgi:hypothetical protein
MEADRIKNRTDEDCGVSEEQFPCPGKCCCKNDSAFLFSYRKACPYCRIATSLPEGERLKTATIIECDRLGYGRRVSE